MAVRDRKNLLNLTKFTKMQKYDELTKALYLRGKPRLSGPFAIRVIDSIVIRTFGLLFSLGKKAATEEEEYHRLTGNFKRIGNIARKLRILGPVNRLLLRLVMRSSVNLLGRQKLFGLNNEKTDVRTAAARYFTAVDIFDFKIEIDSADDQCVAFRFLECPIGYIAGDDMKICMATNKWDRQCVRMAGCRMLIENLIPEGAPACRAHIVPENEKVPDGWRRYPRLTI